MRNRTKVFAAFLVAATMLPAACGDSETSTEPSAAGSDASATQDAAGADSDSSAGGRDGGADARADALDARGEVGSCEDPDCPSPPHVQVQVETCGKLPAKTQCHGFSQDFELSNANPVVGETITITSAVTNGDTDKLAGRFFVAFRQEGSEPFHESNARAILPGATVRVSAELQVPAVSSLKICGEVICGSNSLRDVQIFPQDNIWNVPIDTMPVAAESAAYVANIGSGIPLQLSWMGIPHNIVDGSHPKTFIPATQYSNPGASDVIGYPLPDPYEILIETPLPNSPIECTRRPIPDAADYWFCDCHVLIVDKDNRFLYELFAVNYDPEEDAGSQWRVGAAVKWDLASNELRDNGYPSADAAGLPILPGLLRYEEVKAGEIRHALRFSVPNASTNKRVWPARAGGGDGGVHYAPFGQRFRLKASVDTALFPEFERPILNALKKYGMMIADNGLPWSISTSIDSRWDILAMNDVLKGIGGLKGISGSDFEAVDVSSLMIDAGSAQARTF
jgi:hypothetical protein